VGRTNNSIKVDAGLATIPEYKRIGTFNENLSGKDDGAGEEVAFHTRKRKVTLVFKKRDEKLANAIACQDEVMDEGYRGLFHEVMGMMG
jgi:hypothetical protein